MIDRACRALRSQSKKLIEDGNYENRKWVSGYYLTIFDRGHYFMISVSNVEGSLECDEIASALESPSRYLAQSGTYKTHRSIGYWMTVKVADHWYMISISDINRPFHGQWWMGRLGAA